MKPLISYTRILLCALISVAGLSCKPKSDSSQASQTPFAQAESALKAAGLEQVENDASALLGHYAGQGIKSLSSAELANSPALNKLAAGVRGEIIGIWQDSKTGTGLPAHIRIRFGNPPHESFIYIMAKGGAATNAPDWKKLSSTVFVKE